jgi:hypothetical protein
LVTLFWHHLPHENRRLSFKHTLLLWISSVISNALGKRPKCTKKFNIFAHSRHLCTYVINKIKDLHTTRFRN